ncbi:MAG: 7-cyano-7-deazaguanine synthase QueC [Candidatus Omnitrophica bacterium]|nr:7-cyano-7-deazaguanine synthase QueC [Candidatus Omnitrophota bacterium]
MNNKAVVLLSGGLDSATTLYFAKSKGFVCHCLIFDYNQRHRREIKSAMAVAKKAKCPYSLVKIALPWKGSALLDSKISLPKNQSLTRGGVPSTYVPARNIIFLSFAASYAEAIGARDVFIGANAVDYSGYPDCRPEFIKSYQTMLGKGLKTGVDKKSIRLQTPLIRLTKAQIVTLAKSLKVPLELTWSCYQGGNKPCGVCDSCRFRAKGFEEAKMKDAAL